jgi:hypothetical protein
MDGGITVKLFSKLTDFVLQQEELLKELPSAIKLNAREKD